MHGMAVRHYPGAELAAMGAFTRHGTTVITLPDSAG